jgi:hypothetical protein
MDGWRDRAWLQERARARARACVPVRASERQREPDAYACGGVFEHVSTCIHEYSNSRGLHGGDRDTRQTDTYTADPRPHVHTHIHTNTRTTHARIHARTARTHAHPYTQRTKANTALRLFFSKTELYGKSQMLRRQCFGLDDSLLLLIIATCCYSFQCYGCRNQANADVCLRMR